MTTIDKIIEEILGSYHKFYNNEGIEPNILILGHESEKRFMEIYSMWGFTYKPNGVRAFYNGMEVIIDAENPKRIEAGRVFNEQS